MLTVKCIPRKEPDQLPDKHSFVNSFALLLTLTICLSVSLVFFSEVLLSVSLLSMLLLTELLSHTCHITLHGALTHPSQRKRSCFAPHLLTVFITFKKNILFVFCFFTSRSVSFTRPCKLEQSFFSWRNSFSGEKPTQIFVVLIVLL